jgi:hypothetical protein
MVGNTTKCTRRRSSSSRPQRGRGTGNVDEGREGGGLNRRLVACVCVWYSVRQRYLNEGYARPVPTPHTLHDDCVNVIHQPTVARVPHVAPPFRRQELFIRQQPPAETAPRAVPRCIDDDDGIRAIGIESSRRRSRTPLYDVTRLLSRQCSTMLRFGLERESGVVCDGAVLSRRRDVIKR